MRRTIHAEPDPDAWVPACAGTTNLSFLRQKNTESPARSCAHRRRNGDGGYGGELASRLPEAGSYEVLLPNSNNTQILVIPAKAGIQRLRLRAPVDERHWTPAFAGVTKINPQCSRCLLPNGQHGLAVIRRKRFGQ